MMNKIVLHFAGAILAVFLFGAVTGSLAGLLAALLGLLVGLWLATSLLNWEREAANNLISLLLVITTDALKESARTTQALQEVEEQLHAVYNNPASHPGASVGDGRADTTRYH